MSDQTQGRFDQPHRHYELRDTELRGGTSAWSWVLPALLAIGIILAIAFAGTRGGTPDTVHPGGAGAPVTAPAIGSDTGSDTGPVQPVAPTTAD